MTENKDFAIYFSTTFYLDTNTDVIRTIVERETLEHYKKAPSSFKVRGIKGIDPSVTVYSDGQSTDIKELSGYLLQIGASLAFRGRKYISYAKVYDDVDLYGHPRDGGGCLIVDFDRGEVTDVTIEEISILLQKRKLKIKKRWFTKYKHVLYRSQFDRLVRVLCHCIHKAA